MLTRSDCFWRQCYRLLLDCLVAFGGVGHEMVTDGLHGVGHETVTDGLHGIYVHIHTKYKYAEYTQIHTYMQNTCIINTYNIYIHTYMHKHTYIIYIYT
jgi:hypothetical protein